MRTAAASADGQNTVMATPCRQACNNVPHSLVHRQLLGLHHCTAGGGRQLLRAGRQLLISVRSRKRHHLAAA